jgi:hypothetical protein
VTDPYRLPLAVINEVVSLVFRSLTIDWNGKRGRGRALQRKPSANGAGSTYTSPCDSIL